MQSAATRRAFSFLASKVHQQSLPLSARESQQLLTLLTTSFRDHLDQQHPNAVPVAPPRTSQIPSSRTGKGNASPTRAPSSRTSASQHIESILTNPLFAVKPQRDAHEVLRDPLSWFVNEIAIGAATIPKAVMCLEMLEKNGSRSESQESRKVQEEKKPGAQIAEWLRSSGLETSKEFVGPHGRTLNNKLVRLLVQEREEATIWRWFTYDPQRRMEQTKLAAPAVLAFRARLLSEIVTAKTSKDTSLEEALGVFLKAHQLMEDPRYRLSAKTLQPAGAQLVNHIVANPQLPVSLEPFESFLRSSREWTGKWTRAIEAILWLHHPTKPDALPGFLYIRDPKGAASQIPEAVPKRRQFLVQLCLGVAHQLLAEQRFANAQAILEFTKGKFADILGVDASASEPKPIKGYKAALAHEKQLEEERNLEMLDQLIPG